MAPGRSPVRAYPAAQIAVTPGRQLGGRAVSGIERGELCVPARVIGGVCDSWYNVRRNSVARRRDSWTSKPTRRLPSRVLIRLAAKESVSRNTSAVVVASRELAAMEFLSRRDFLSFN
jgi:hypothetical protein